MKMCNLLRFFSCLLLIALLSTVSGELDIEIVTMGYLKLAGYSSLSFTGPAIDSAIEELRVDYKGRFRFLHTYLFNKSIPDSYSLMENSAYMLSDWYYRKVASTNMMAYISPGNLNVP